MRERSSSSDSAVVLVGVATGLAPAWQAGRLDVTRFLRIGAREGTLQRSPLRASLLVIQAALSVLLLVAAGLFVRSVNEARHLHMGYDVDRLLVVGLNMRGVRLDSARSEDLWQRISNASRTVPASNALRSGATFHCATSQSPTSSGRRRWTRCGSSSCRSWFRTS